jgi:PhnB protein
MPQASTTPAGFHGATPYLIFDGTAADAIAFYRGAFAATELPGRLTDPAGRILDAAILIGDSVIRVGDEAPWRIAKSPRTLGGASSFVHLYVTDAAPSAEFALVGACSSCLCEPPSEAVRSRLL